MGQPNRAAVLVIALAIVVDLPAGAASLRYRLTPTTTLYLAHAEELGLSTTPVRRERHATPPRPRAGRSWGAAREAGASRWRERSTTSRFVRIVTVAGIVALALLLYWALVRVEDRSPACGPDRAARLHPAGRSSSTRRGAITFPLPWAALLAGVASLLAVAAVDAPRQQLDRLVCAQRGLLIVALLIVPADGDVLRGLLRRRAGRHGGRLRDAPLRLARAHFGVAAVALARRVSRVQALRAELVGGRARPRQRPRRAPHATASSPRPSGSPTGRSTESLNLFDLTPVGLAGCSSSPRSRPAASLLWLVRRCERGHGCTSCSARSSSSRSPYLPNLVVEETSRLAGIIRTQSSLSALIALYFGLGALAIWVTFREWLEGRVSRPALLVE